MADSLTGQFHFKKISSSSHLRALAQQRGLPETRATLQELGDLLDEETSFSWLVDDVASIQVENEPDQLSWYVDAVRKPEQVRYFRGKFPNVLHVHLTAPEEALRARFAKRARDGDEAKSPDSYERCVAHPNEQSSRSLCDTADLIIDLNKAAPADAAALIVSYERRSP